MVCGVELKVLGQATAVESGLEAVRTTIKYYSRIARDVLPAGEEVEAVLSALHRLLLVANSKFTVRTKTPLTSVFKTRYNRVYSPSLFS